METQSFTIPEFSTEKPEFPPNRLQSEGAIVMTDVPVEKPKRDRTENFKKKTVLSKVNRTLNCIYCDEERILNPEQYQSYFDYWGDEEKIKRNFICKPCEVKEDTNPFAFWIDHHELVKRFSKNVKVVCDLYNSSPKAVGDVLNLQNGSNAILAASKIDMGNVDFIRESPTNPMTNIIGIKIKNMPFVGEIEIKPYETKKIILT